MKATRILLVEDNPVDVKLLSYAFAQTGDWMIDLTTAEDGEIAIGMLSQSSADSKPDFVILDLNLPKRSGTEVLAEIRRSEVLHDMRVAVLSSSPLDVIRDRFLDANVHADGYFTKPMDVDSFVALAGELRACCYG